jgi:hypothetical protein
MLGIRASPSGAYVLVLLNGAPAELWAIGRSARPFRCARALLCPAAAAALLRPCPAAAGTAAQMARCGQRGATAAALPARRLPRPSAASP